MDIIRRLFIAIVMIAIGTAAFFITSLLGNESSVGKFFGVLGTIGVLGGIFFGLKSIKDRFG